MALANYIVFLQISQVRMTSYMPFAKVKYNPREQILRGSHWVLLDQTTTTFLRGGFALYCFTMFPRQILVFAALGLCFALVAGATQVSGVKRWELRRRFSFEDSFYHPPSGWESASPGEVLASRKVDVSPASIFNLGINAYQLLYRTTGLTDGEATTSVTTVLVPYNYDKDKVMVAALYEDSFSSECAPSKQLKSGHFISQNVAVAYQSLFLTTLLHEGWVVTVPDHEGPQNAFGAGPLEGHTILDAVRATINYDRIGLDSNAKVTGYGYSGGAMALGWAASLHKSYASELNVVGWAMGGTVTRMADWLRYIDGTGGAGFAVAALGGISSVDNDLQWVQDNLTLLGKIVLEKSKHSCMYKNLLEEAYKRFISDTYFQGGSAFFENSDAMYALNKYNLGADGSKVPSAPVFMFHARNDIVVPYAMAQGTARSWCQQGAQIRFTTYAGVEMGHTSAGIASLPDVLHFLRDRFNGKQWGETCQYPVLLDPWFNLFNLGESYAEFVQQLLDLLGRRIGKDDHILMAKLKKQEVP